jgi:hypothetical protein
MPNFMSILLRSRQVGDWSTLRTNPQAAAGLPPVCTRSALAGQRFDFFTDKA